LKIEKIIIFGKRLKSAMLQSEELIFSELTMKDKEWVSEALWSDGRAVCAYTFASNYAWKDYYALFFARYGDSGVFRYEEEHHEIYSFPFGGGEEDKKRLLDRIIGTCEETGQELQLSPLSKADYDCLRRWYPGQFLVTPNRDLADYIYEREKLVTLPGKKYHGKRNHIARFKDADDWAYEPITEENRRDALGMMQEWKEKRSGEWNVEMEQEFGAMTTALLEMEALGLVGGLLRKAGHVVALAMGEPLNADTFVVHYEKAFGDVQGAYPMINQQFAEHAAEGYTYINREEDTGDPGLRKAKLSYRPCRLEDKYTAIKSEVVFAHPEDIHVLAQVCGLWRSCFDDGDFAEFFVRERVTDQNMLLIYRDGKPVSMGTFFPAVYHTKNGDLSVRYLYALATHPDHRGEGLAEQIMTCGMELWDEPIVLSPGEPSLYRYYEKRGFVRCFRSEQRGERLAPARNCRWNFRLEQADPERYAQVRDRYYSDNRSAYLSWDAGAIDFAFRANEREGGRNLLVIPEAAEDRAQLLMYVLEGRSLVILETSLSEELLNQLLPELFAETGATSVRYDIPGGMMLLPDRLAGFELPGDGYLNLTLG
jgi:hypothetical protein